MAIADLQLAPARENRATRDTGIDLVRAFCVLGVVVLHSLMVGVTVTQAGPIFANASEGAGWIVPLSWIFQVMPLFFVIAGFAGYTSYQRSRRRGGTATSFASARIHRLLLPAAWTIGIVGIALTALLVVGVPNELVGIAGYRFGQPLWFLGVFLLCQVLLPALAAAHERARWRTLALLVAAAISIDAARMLTGDALFGVLNLAFVWLALQQLGFFLADGYIPSMLRRIRVVIGVGATAALVISVMSGIYSPDLIENINPPTTALLLVGVAHTMVMSLVRDRLNRWSQSRLGTAMRRFVTPRTMTIYLWHMPVLLVMAGTSALFAIITGIALPEPSSLTWWQTRPLWLLVVLTLTAGVALVLARIEAIPAPVNTESAARLTCATVIGIGAIAGLLVIGTTPVTAALATVALLASLRLARSRDDRRTAGGVR